MDYQMDRSSEVQELVQALAKAQMAMQNPKFDSTNPHFRTKYASLAAVRDATIPALAANNIAVTQLITTEDAHVICLTTLWHSSGQYLSNALRLPVSKADVQGFGGAITYARRYSLQAICNVVGEQDDDGESQRESVQSRQQANAEQRARQEWTNKIQGLLVAQGLSEDEIAKYWRHIAHKYGEVLSLATLQKIHSEMEVRAKAKQEKPAKPAPSAWRDIVEAHADLATGELAEQVAQAMTDPHYSDSAGNALAMQLADLAAA